MRFPGSNPFAANRVPRRRVLSWLLAMAGVRAGSFGEAHAAAAFVVVVHPDNPSASVTRTFLAQVFLKRASRWSDGAGINPVDLLGSSQVRRKFSEEVLSRSVSAVRSYWQQRIFSGRGVPPPELASDEAVVEFVRRRRGAVGYVSAGTTLQGVKVLQVT